MAFPPARPTLGLAMSLDLRGAPTDGVRLAWPQPGQAPEPDPAGPHGNHGEVFCGACWQKGWLMSMNERGFLVRHDGRMFPCRAPLEARPMPERLVAQLALTN